MEFLKSNYIVPYYTINFEGDKMHCPECDEQLEEYDRLLKYGEVVGTIYICPNGYESWSEELDESHNDFCSSAYHDVAGRWHQYGEYDLQPGQGC